MSDENKEKNLPETPDEGKEKVDGDWKWDAAVPETKIDDITFDDLATAAEDKSAAVKDEEVSQDEQPEKKAEKKENKKPEKKEKAAKEEKDDAVCIVCG